MGRVLGVVRGATVVLDDNANLGEGTHVVITPIVPGTPAAVLAAVDAAAPVPADWVDELDQLIAQGRRPQVCIDPFEKDSRGAEAT